MSLRRGNWRAGLHALSAYLPALLMALLAAATWWLVRNTPVPDAPPPEAAPRHEPDYEMSRFSLQIHRPASGVHELLEGEELRHYPDTDTIEVDQARLRATDGLGRVTSARARRAVVQGDGSEVLLEPSPAHGTWRVEVHAIGEGVVRLFASSVQQVA